MAVLIPTVFGQLGLVHYAHFCVIIAEEGVILGRAHGSVGVVVVIEPGHFANAFDAGHGVDGAAVGEGRLGAEVGSDELFLGGGLDVVEEVLDVLFVTF